MFSPNTLEGTLQKVKTAGRFLSSRSNPSPVHYGTTNLCQRHRKELQLPKIPVRCGDPPKASAINHLLFAPLGVYPHPCCIASGCQAPFPPAPQSFTLTTVLLFAVFFSPPPLLWFQGHFILPRPLLPRVAPASAWREHSRVRDARLGHVPSCG